VRVILEEVVEMGIAQVMDLNQHILTTVDK